MNDTISMPDLQTEAGALTFAHLLMVGMKQNFERDGYLAPVAFLVGCDRPAQPRARVGQFTVMEVMPNVVLISTSQLESSEDKRRFAYLIRGCAAASHAAGVLFGSEAWLATVAPNDEEKIARIARDGVESLADHREGIIVLLEHRGLTNRIAQWQADIERDGKTVTLKDFVDLPLETQVGRFAQFLED